MINTRKLINKLDEIKLDLKVLELIKILQEINIIKEKL